LYQQFSNWLISQRDMSGPRLGALSNNRWSGGINPGFLEHKVKKRRKKTRSTSKNPNKRFPFANNAIMIDINNAIYLFIQHWQHGSFWIANTWLYNIHHDNVQRRVTVVSCTYCSRKPKSLLAHPLLNAGNRQIAGSQKFACTMVSSSLLPDPRVSPAFQFKSRLSN
jgi:hypothetical protein